MICAAWPEEVQTAADAALERGDPLGQRHHRRVGQARVDVADLLQVEERRGVLGVAEDVGGVLVDRRLPRAGRRVGLGAGMDLQRVETQRLSSVIFVPPRMARRRGYASAPGADNRRPRGPLPGRACRAVCSGRRDGTRRSFAR